MTIENLKPITIPESANCFRLGCRDEPTQSALYPQPNHETKKIYFCERCYDVLTSSRIIIDGKVKEW